MRTSLMLNKMRHPDDFILLVILDHIRPPDDRHKVLGMANLSLQTIPDLVRPEPSVYVVEQRTTMLSSHSPHE